MENFYLERKQYSEIIEKRISSLKEGYRQNIAVIGDELVGKTSIIFKLLDKFYDNRILIIYLECRPESLSVFAKRFIGVMLYNFLNNSGIPLKEDLNFLIAKSSKYIPKTTEKVNTILGLLEKRTKNNIFTELLSLCESIHHETGKSCVVVFDEFHNLENIGANNLYNEWSKLLLLQKNTMYIIVSSLKFKAKTILSKNLSLLFGNFETLTIEPFDTRDSEYYLEQKFTETGLAGGVKKFIIHFTGGFPFYLKIISDALIKASSENLTQILEDMIFEHSGILNQRFTNYIKRFHDSNFSQDYLSILYLIACGHNRLKEITDVMHKPKKELNLRIARLLELDAVTRSGDFLKINDRIFSFWLKFVYQEKLHSLTFDAKNQKNLFRDNIESMLQEFLASSQKPVTERLTELMRLFDDDTIQIERKRIKLSHFREIKPLEFNRGRLKSGLIGRCSESLWIMALKQESSLTEDDITEFSKECKKYRHKLQKKIIIAFCDIDANAKLRALEEKILTWDLNNLNQIFDLFSKPRVIL